MSHQQIAVTASQIATSSRPVQDLASVLPQQLTSRQQQNIRKKIKEIGYHCLTTLALSSLFLAAAYLFLVQLAEGGW